MLLKANNNLMLLQANNNQLFFAVYFPFDIFGGGGVVSAPGVDPLLHSSSKPTTGFTYEWKQGNLTKMTYNRLVSAT